MSKYLIIDTATIDSSICLLLGKKKLVQNPLPQMNQTKDLIPVIKKILDKEHLTLENLTGIAICTGPGLFTGTRVGVMTAKSLSYASNIPLYPFSSFDLFKESSPYAALDAKCGRCYLKNEKSTQLVVHKRLADVQGQIFVLDPSPFKKISTEFSVTTKDYLRVYDLLEGLTPISHEEIQIEYPTS